MPAARISALSPSFFSRAHAFGAPTVNFLFALTYIVFATSTLNAMDKKLAKAASQISDAKFEICLPAIETLGHSKNTEVVGRLTQAFDVEERPLVRRYIVDALGLLGSRQGQPTLAKALQDPDAQVRQSAVVALSSFADTASQQLIIDRAQNETNFAVKAHLVQALGRSNHPGAAAKLRSFSREQDPTLRKMADEEISKRSKHGKK